MSNNTTVCVKTKKFCLWVENELIASDLNHVFYVKNYRDKEIDTDTIHYILATPETEEATIKAVAWRTIKSGCLPEIYTTNQPLEILLDGSAMVAKDLAIQIFEFAQPFDRWLIRQDSQALTLRQAVKIAEAAIAFLEDPQKSVELQSLQQRCGCSSWDWNKVVKGLEGEFKRELERRGLEQKELDAISKAREILKSGLTEIEEIIQLEQLRRKTDYSSSHWDRKVIPSLRRELQPVRLDLDIRLYLRESDPNKQMALRNTILTKYCISRKDFETRCETLLFEESRPQGETKYLSLKELFAIANTKVEWLVEGLIPAGVGGIVTGDSGVGKTLWAVELAHAVATGNKFLGEITRKGKVLFISTDQPGNITASYFFKRGFDPEEHESQVKLVLDLPQMPLWSIKEINKLEQWVDEFRPDLVVLDSLRSIIQQPLGLEEKDAKNGRWVKEVERIATRYGGTCITLHHNSKNPNNVGVNKASGHGSIISNTSFHYSLEKAAPKEDDDPGRILRMHKTRGWEPVNLDLTLNGVNCEWVCNGRVGESPEVASANKNTSERILEFLKTNANTWYSVEEVRNGMGGGTSVGTLLSRLVNKTLISSRRSKGNKHNKMVYCYEVVLPSPPNVCDGDVNLNSESIANKESCSLNDSLNDSLSSLNSSNSLNSCSNSQSTSNKESCSFNASLNNSLNKGGGVAPGQGTTESLKVAQDTSLPPLKLRSDNPEAKLADFQRCLVMDKNGRKYEAFTIASNGKLVVNSLDNKKTHYFEIDDLM